MSDVTRSMEATAGRVAGRVARQRRAQPNGQWGMLLLIATEAALFATLLASYYFLRFRSAEWPLGGIAPPDVLHPSLLTGVLVATSVPMAIAGRAARQGRARATWLALFGALFVQAGYLAMQIHDLVDSLHSFGGGENAYASIYYTLIGVHHVHVAIGMLLIVGLLIKLARGLTNYRVIGVRAVALYWYFTNAVAVAVLLTQISPSL